MRVTRTASAAFTAEFESEEELREEHLRNLSQGGLRLVTAEAVALHATLLVTLRGPWGEEAFVRATVVANLSDGVALFVDGYGEEQFLRLLEKPPEPATPVAEAPVEEEPHDSADDAVSVQRRQSVWDRVRAMPQIDKILLAVRADRTERALLLQDSDPRVLLSLLRNPRLTVEEVTRVAKSTSMNFQIADVIAKAGQWMGSPDVRLALVYNPKTPPPLALRILPMLPDADVRNIARGGSSMALKTAALRRLQGKV